MPSPSDFRKAFKLGVGQELGDKWTITISSFGHDVKEQNERYEFPAALEVEWATGGGGGGGGRGAERRRALEGAWAKQTKEKRIVHSAYGSPYECCFVGKPEVAPLDEEGSCFKITALGRAVRRRDIPTLRETKAAEREAAGVAAEVSKEDEKRHLGGYRVIKSRFGASKCSICGSTIDPGVKIAKGEGDSSRSGWAHATCVLQRLKRGGGGEQEEAEEGSSEAGRSGEEESEEEAPPPKRRAKAPAATAKGGRSGGGRAGKAAGRAGAKSSAAGGAGTKRRRASSHAAAEE